MPNKTDDAKLEALIGRRALLQGSAVGGAALAAGLFGPLAAAGGRAGGEGRAGRAGQGAAGSGAC